MKERGLRRAQGAILFFQHTDCTFGHPGTFFRDQEVEGSNPVTPTKLTTPQVELRTSDVSTLSRSNSCFQTIQSAAPDATAADVLGCELGAVGIVLASGAGRLPRQRLVPNFLADLQALFPILARSTREDGLHVLLPLATAIDAPLNCIGMPVAFSPAVSCHTYEKIRRCKDVVFTTSLFLDKSDSKCFIRTKRSASLPSFAL